MVKTITVPLLVCVLATLLGISVASRGPSGDSSDEGSDVLAPRAASLASKVPRKQWVPVRRGPAQAGPPTIPGQGVALRQLVIATDPEDFELPGWKAVLDKIGTPYDVMYARTDPFGPKRLVRDDGVGRYSAILLTNGGLRFRDGTGRYPSAFDATKWSRLWEYERTFHVRQVALNTTPGSEPEDYCLEHESEGATGRTPVYAALTTSGAGMFDYLRPDAKLPISQSYLYRTTIRSGCPAQPILTLGSQVIGVVSTATDGRERAALTFSLGAIQPAAELLGHGLLRWATHGVFVGEQRHWINVDVDDWFNANLHGPAGGTSGVFRLTGPEALAISKAQTALQTAHPLAKGFTLNLAFNGRGINRNAPAQCSTKETPDSLTSFSRCLIDKFRWINHTFAHPPMNSDSYSQAYTEINQNLAAAAAIGLPVPAEVLKTPEYSGLGVYNPDRTTLSGAVVDFGLDASNKHLLKAASTLGVQYLHGNMSFASHRPTCFNCGVHHPLQPDLMLVPDWPTNIAWEATTPEELTSRYNAAYGVKGTSKDRLGHDVTYQQIVDSEAEVALRHLMNGSAYSHTLHQTNLHEYAPGRSLAFDWLQALVARYSTYYQVPLKNPDWSTLAAYVKARTSHFASLAAGQDAVWNRVTGAVTYTPSSDGSLFLTGLATRPATEADLAGPDQSETYGTDTVSQLGLTRGSTMSYTARPRS
ncbi:MAG TPA: hypothetical protein VHN80_21660 [Kineosporiaceae bacterium]|nr:hypothetical protein [Kineosporiaceae bacterium]